MKTKTFKLIVCFYFFFSITGDVCFSADNTVLSQRDLNFKKGLSHYYNKEYLEAIQIFEKDIKDYPGNLKVDYDYGWGMRAYAQLGQYDKALQYCEILCTKYYGWIEMGGPKRKWDDAVREIREIIEHDETIKPDAKELYLRKINEYLDIAFKKSPPEFEIGLRHYYKKEYLEAIQIFESDIADFPENVDIDYDYGWAMKAYAQLGQYDKALKYCEILCTKYFGWVEKGNTKRKWNNAILETRGIIKDDKTITPDSKELYLKKIDDYINIAIKNTPPEIYPKFMAFHPEAGETTIEFSDEPFNGVNWESLIPPGIKSGDAETNITGQSAKLKTNALKNSKIKHAAPMPEYVAKYFYYLVTSGGVKKLALKNIAKGKGVVAVLKGPTQQVNGGFVMQSDKDFQIAISRFTGKEKLDVQTNDKTIIYTYKMTGEKDLVLTRNADHETGIEGGYFFSVNGQKYIFIQWQPDENCSYGCCTNDYMLFKISDKLEELMWSRYNCDV